MEPSASGRSRRTARLGGAECAGGERSTPQSGAVQGSGLRVPEDAAVGSRGSSLPALVTAKGLRASKAFRNWRLPRFAYHQAAPSERYRLAM